MPLRDNTQSAVQRTSVDGTASESRLAGAVGMYQSISSLNNEGSFTAGEYKVNPVVLQKWTMESTPGSGGSDKYTVSNQDHVLSISGQGGSFIMNAATMSRGSSNWSFYTNWDNTRAQLSQQRAFANAFSAELDVGTMIGELRETIEGLRDPISALRDYIKLWNKLRKLSKRPKMSDTFNMLSGSWLEWRYGICPLISSIQGIIDAVMAQSRALNDQVLRAKGKSKAPIVTKVLKATTGAGNYSLNGSVNLTVETVYITKVYYRLVRPLTFNEAYGLTMAHVPGIMWELTKLSFVWDWFFSVGDWIGGLNPNNARSVLGSCTSQKSTVTAHANVDKATFLNGTRTSSYQASATTVYEKLDRRVNIPRALTPLVTAEWLSLKRSIDALTLTWQFLPKLKR